MADKKVPPLFERKGNMIIMDRREPRMGYCEACGTIDDLRPYGLNNENICFDCAMKNPDITDDRMREMLKGGQS